jgi:hypothetical protein
MFQGKNVEQKSAAEVASTTSGSTTTTDGSTPAPAASSTPATTTTTTTTPDVTPEEQGDASEAAQRILKDFPQIGSRGSSQQIYASGLGFYMKKSGAGRPGRGDYGDPPQAGADMEHPDHGGVRASHAGTGHNRGVALDLGGHSATSGSYEDDQKNLWPFITNYLKKYGLNKEPYVPQVIHGPGESFAPRKMDTMGPDRGHHDHFHVEFEGGGYVGGKYNMKSIERRASYEGGEQMISIPIPMPQQPNIQQPETSMMGPVSAVSSDDPFEFLEFQG